MAASPRANYKAGQLTSGTAVVLGNVRSVSLIAETAATLTLQAVDPVLSADTITLPAGAAQVVNFFDSVRDLTITRLSGTIDYLAWFTP